MAIQRIKSFNLFNKVLGNVGFSSDMWEIKQMQANGEVHSWHSWLFVGPVTLRDELLGTLTCFNITILWFNLTIGFP